MRDLIEFFTMVVLTMAIVAFLLIFSCNWYSQYKCGNYQKITGIETKYASYDACYVKTISGWQRWDEYKARAIASEGLSK